MADRGSRTRYGSAFGEALRVAVFVPEASFFLSEDQFFHAPAGHRRPQEGFFPQSRYHGMGKRKKWPAVRAGRMIPPFLMPERVVLPCCFRGGVFFGGGEAAVQSREYGAELSGPCPGVFPQRQPAPGLFFPEVRKIRICRPCLPRRLPKRRGSLFSPAPEGSFLRGGGASLTGRCGTGRKCSVLFARFFCRKRA